MKFDGLKVSSVRRTNATVILNVAAVGSSDASNDDTIFSLTLYLRIIAGSFAVNGFHIPVNELHGVGTVNQAE